MVRDTILLLGESKKRRRQPVAHLAKRLEDPNSRILVTTFTTNLSVTIKNQIQRLDPTVAEQIEVTNLHALARTICNRAGWHGRIAGSDVSWISWHRRGGSTTHSSS